MVLIRTLLLLILIAGGLAAGLGPQAHAHEKHQSAAKERARPIEARAPGVPPSAMQEQMEEHMDAMEAQQPRTVPERLVSWFGRMHPFAVHFPIALFPVALVALVLARRRGETVELIRALIVVAGAASVIAAALGWLNGGLTINDADTVLMLHRWVGTVLAFIGGAVAWWAWRRRASVHSGRMVAALGLIVALLLVQGFLGASVTHGMEHMMF
ncbi:MAG TPA: DUF2231 domain-containing protein [Allosphingosinicella sp.]|jgi:uncharacterized membrane protein|uniref:DUF2231 domain-containing protein n=1 Tax=Allosphingosinicella sp. TaxID=2823234 RepID=UPI002F27B9F0